MDNGTPTVVARTHTPSEASVIKSLLESYDIPCHFNSARIPHYIYPLPTVGFSEIRIYVPAPLADAARDILGDHRRRHAHLRLVDKDEN